MKPGHRDHSAARIAAVAPARATAGFKTLEEWLAWQERLHFPEIELGLERCRVVAERMGLLSPPFAVVTVAGTNGKGSSASMLDIALRNGGYRVGKYTSPHLMRYNERICVDGAEIQDVELCRVFGRIDRARGDISLTYFEFGTLAAIQVFRDRDVDVAIMEVGLGGRLDAVNLLDADVALLTTIDIDHERWLGYDRESIGREKSGVFRAGKPAVCADPQPPDSVISTARAVGADLIVAGRDFRHSAGADSWNFESNRGGNLNGLPLPSADHGRQVQNAAGVLMALHMLSERFPLSPDVINRSLRAFRLPGRFQVVPGRVPVILDVAHNRQAAEALALNLRNQPCSGRTHVVIGMLKDKNHASFISEMLGQADRWYVATLHHERGADSSSIARTLRELDPSRRVEEYDQVAEAVDSALAATGAGDRVVITGSFLTVSAALRRLNLPV